MLLVVEINCCALLVDDEEENTTVLLTSEVDAWRINGVVLDNPTGTVAAAEDTFIDLDDEDANLMGIPLTFDIRPNSSSSSLTLLSIPFSGVFNEENDEKEIDDEDDNGELVVNKDENEDENDGDDEGDDILGTNCAKITL